MIFRRAVARLRAQDWTAITIELLIVTLGVMIALAAQQWAEGRSWGDKVSASKVALRAELAEHYNYAVEYRVVYPCLQAQIGALRNRVLSSGTTLDAAPVFTEPGDDFVLRMPAKIYPTDAWEEALDDGSVQRFDASLRRQLAGHYAQLANVRTMNLASNESEAGFMALTHTIPLDPSSRYAIVREIEQLSGRLQYLDTINGQVIDYIEHMAMVPPAGDAQAITQRYGTYRFCRAHGFPMRPFKEAMQAVAN